MGSQGKSGHVDRRRGSEFGEGSLDGVVDGEGEVIGGRWSQDEGEGGA